MKIAVVRFKACLLMLGLGFALHAGAQTDQKQGQCPELTNKYEKECAAEVIKNKCKQEQASGTDCDYKVQCNRRQFKVRILCPIFGG